MCKSGNGSISVLGLIHFKTIKNLMERPEDIMEAATKNCKFLVKVVKNNALQQAGDFNPTASLYLEQAH